MEKLKLVEVSSELAAGTRGASLGVGAIKTASLNKGSDFFRKYKTTAVPTINESLFLDIENPYAKHIHEVRIMLERTCETISDTINKGFVPVVLAGDHSTAAGTICGIKNANPDKRIGVIWIDAHADFHTPYTSPSGNMHGFSLAIAAAIDNLECRVNNPKESTLQEWEEIKKIGVDGPKIKPEDVVFIGVRSTEEPERCLMENHGIRNFTVSEVREKGVKAIAEEALSRLADCDLVYVSFDVDSMDPDAISEGTGTPVPNGLYEDEAKELNRLLVQHPKVCAWEIVEVNPTLDEHNAMAETAFEIIESTVKALENRSAEVKI
ncbi:arginase [Nafulsella turpanensis]|uniref:arginase n=1 Tax=Nafulsella turpanensis TaxID=1265690 RepID=UPI000344FF0A|nr:arginase [Nafulsella turpanensis]